MSADPLAKVRRQLRTQLRERVDARGLSAAPRTERRLRVREEALSLMRESGALLPQRDLARVVNEVSDEVVGFGPIEFLLRDPGVTEAIVNGWAGLLVTDLDVADESPCSDLELGTLARFHANALIAEECATARDHPCPG